MPGGVTGCLSGPDVADRGDGDHGDTGCGTAVGGALRRCNGAAVRPRVVSPLRPAAACGRPAWPEPTSATAASDKTIVKTGQRRDYTGLTRGFTTLCRPSPSSAHHVALRMLSREGRRSVDECVYSRSSKRTGVFSEMARLARFPSTWSRYLGATPNPGRTLRTASAVTTCPAWIGRTK